MMGSFLITNSGPCFDNYAKIIASKKKHANSINGGASMNAATAQMSATANS